MKKSGDTSTLEGLLRLIVGIPLIMLNVVYSVFVITKLVQWFKVPLILSQAQWIGIVAIIGIIMFKTDDNKSDTSFSTMITNNATHAIVVIMCLGIYYILHFIIN